MTEQDGPSPLELPKQSEERLVHLSQTGKYLIVDFSHLSSSSTLGDSYWECKRPFNKNNQVWFKYYHACLRGVTIFFSFF